MLSRVLFVCSLSIIFYVAFRSTPETAKPIAPPIRPPHIDPHSFATWLSPPSETCSAHLAHTSAIPALDRDRNASPTDLKVVMVLDKSGSMEGIYRDVLGSANSFIADQQKLMSSAEMSDVHATFSLLQFSDRLQWIRVDEKLSTIRPLTESDYTLGGSTALYDGIGEALHKFRDHRNVVLVIVTDGEENASRRFNQATVKPALGCFQDRANWNVIYLSASAEGFAAGHSMGVNANIQSSYESLSSDMEESLSEAAIGISLKTLYSAVGIKKEYDEALAKHGGMDS